MDPAHPMALVVTHFSDDRRSTPAAFEILVDGQRIAEQTLGRTEPGEFFDVEHAIPRELVRGKERVTVRFQARDGKYIAAVFGVRMVRADAER